MGEKPLRHNPTIPSVGALQVTLTYLYNSGNAERKAHIVINHLTTKGGLDHSFGRGGTVVLPGSGGYEELTLAVARDGGVVLAAGEDVAGPPKRKRLLVLRYTKTGRPDNSFGYEGVVARTWVNQDVILPHSYTDPKGVVPSVIAFDARGDAVIAGSKYTYTPDTGTVGSWFLTQAHAQGIRLLIWPQRRSVRRHGNQRQRRSDPGRPTHRDRRRTRPRNHGRSLHGRVRRAPAQANVRHPSTSFAQAAKAPLSSPKRQKMLDGEGGIRTRDGV